jgi:hypothetical protein
MVAATMCREVNDTGSKPSVSTVAYRSRLRIDQSTPPMISAVIMPA